MSILNGLQISIKTANFTPPFSEIQLCYIFSQDTTRRMFIARENLDLSRGKSSFGSKSGIFHKISVAVLTYSSATQMPQVSAHVTDFTLWHSMLITFLILIRFRKNVKNYYWLCHICPSVSLSFSMKQAGSHWTDFHKIWYFSTYRKYVDSFRRGNRGAEKSI